MLIIDTSTGTVLNAHTCVLVPDDALSEAEWEALDNMSDTESADIGRERGRPILPDSQALDAIAEKLSGVEWNVDTLMEISDLITATGRTIEDVQ
jgi:hypothetical protein